MPDDSVEKYRAEGVEWAILTPKPQAESFRWPIQHSKLCISQQSQSGTGSITIIT